MTPKQRVQRNQTAGKTSQSNRRSVTMKSDTDFRERVEGEVVGPLEEHEKEKAAQLAAMFNKP